MGMQNLPEGGGCGSLFIYHIEIENASPRKRADTCCLNPCSKVAVDERFKKARVQKKSLSWVENFVETSLGSPAACRGGGGPLIRDAGQYLNFAPFGGLLLAFLFGQMMSTNP